MIRTGFGRLDENGNLVSVWNFGEWVDVLTEVDSSGHRKFGPVIAVARDDQPIALEITAQGKVAEVGDMLQLIKSHSSSPMSGLVTDTTVKCEVLPELENSLMLGEFHSDMPDLEPCLARTRVPIPPMALKYFPLLPRLQSMYKTDLKASYMMWDSRRNSRLHKWSGTSKALMDDHLFRAVCICFEILASVVLMHALCFSWELLGHVAMKWTNAIFETRGSYYGFE